MLTDLPSKRNCAVDSDPERRIEAIDREIQQLINDRAAALNEREGALMPRLNSPEREAEWMRRLVERHNGETSLIQLEHIWRELTMNAVSPTGRVRIFMEERPEDLIELYDLARFYFGFSAPLEISGDPSDVIREVALSGNNLQTLSFGLIAIEERADLPWWRSLASDEALGPKITARLPFFVCEDRPADLPAFVISSAVDPTEILAMDMAVYDARWRGAAPGKLMNSGVEVMAFHRTTEGVDAMIAVRADMPAAEISTLCEEAGAPPQTLRRIGGFAAPIDLDDMSNADFGADS